MFGLLNLSDKYMTHVHFFMNGETWKSIRAAQTPYFTAKKLRNLIHHVQLVASNFLENVENLRSTSKSSEVEVIKLSKCYALDTIAKVLFAIDCNSFKDRDNPFVKYAMHIGEVNVLQIVLIAILPRKISQLLKLSTFKTEPFDKLGDYFEKLLEQRKKRGIKYQDFSELLQNAQDEKKVNLTKEEFIANILGFFFAGIDTISNAIGNGLLLLSQNPEVQAKLYKEVVNEFNDGIDYDKLVQNPYLDAVISEMIRIGNQNLILNRVADKDTKLGDIAIEKGTEIRMILYMLHMNNEKKSSFDPSVFNPDRFLNKTEESKKEGSGLFIPFGYGPKRCPADRLVLLELKFAFVSLIKKYEILEAKESGMIRQNFRGFSIIEKLNIQFKPRPQS